MIETTTVPRDIVTIGTTTTIVILETEIVTGITRTGTGMTDTERIDIARIDTGSPTDTSGLHETTTSGIEDMTDTRGTDITTRAAPAGGHPPLDLLLTGDLTTEVMDDDNNHGGDDDLVKDLYLDFNFWIFWCFTAHLALPTPTINHILYQLNISPFQQFSGGK